VEAIKLNPVSRDDFINLLDAAKMCDKVNEAKEVFKVYRKNFPSLEAISRDFEI
jgi:hypothetical protein